MSVSYNNQRLQTVLLLEGFNLGPKGVDGWRGEMTQKAIESFAKKHGIEGNQAQVERAILDKLKDPKFIQGSLDKLADNKPDTTSNTAAIQVLLAAAGHDDSRMKTAIGAAGIMHGRMNEATKTALENTEDGRPNATAATALGIPNSAIKLALGHLENRFAEASNPATSTGLSGQPTVSRVAAVDLTRAP